MGHPTKRAHSDFLHSVYNSLLSESKIGNNINVLQQAACLVFNQITVGNFAFLFNCTPLDQASDSYDGSDLSIDEIVEA